MEQIKQTDAAKRLRNTYEMKPGAPFYHKTFGFWMCGETWFENGLPRDTDFDEFFMLDGPGNHSLGRLGWTEAAFEPFFEEKVLEDRGEHELVQDFAGRGVLYFKGKRQGFMPEYIDHPVKDWKTWENDVKWRMAPGNPARYAGLESRMATAKLAVDDGLMITQDVIGGYMFLRSIMGPEEVMYVFYDDPVLVHDCMTAWFELSDSVIAKHQQHVILDELFLAEDICYNGGSLISPDMINEFLMPYYQQLLANAKSRQLDKTRRLYVQVDTDGRAEDVINVYREGIGMDVMSPFEVASGSDVVELGEKYPWLVMSGGIDKRVLPRSTDEIDRYLDGILPVMRERGGYIPTCDHGVPPEVSWQNYLHYRKRCVEYGQ